GYLAKLLYGVPLVVTCHSLEPLRPWKEEQLGKGYRLSSWAEKTAIESADRVIAVSKSVKEDILRHFNVSSDRVAVIHNGIDLNKWKKTTGDYTKKRYGIEDPYVLFVGRTTRQKGMVHLLDAADYIDPGLQLVCCTCAPDTQEVEDEITQKVAEKKNVLWINELLKEEQYIELYSGAAVFACPSIYEPFGIINLEAMACETPVVASAVGGIKEVVIPDETGILVEPENPKQLASGINHLLRNPALARRLAENGRSRVERYFSWKLVAQQTKKLYEALI
ncbi:MAG: glycogen synthase, partial [bacterium]